MCLGCEVGRFGENCKQCIGCHTYDIVSGECGMWYLFNLWDAVDHK